MTLLYEDKGINKLDTRLLQMGMFFTVLADFFLVISEDNAIGVALFCVVQIIYISRYDVDGFSLIITRLTVELVTILIGYYLINKLIVKLDFIIPLAFFYSICLLTSVFKSIKIFKTNKYPNPNKYMIILGMFLFLLCDICVGLSNLIGIFYNLIWLFYIPSQILLALSGYDYKRNFIV